VLNGHQTVVSNADATESFEPTDRALDHPSYPSKAASVILSPTSDDRLDALCTQGISSGLAVVSTIREQDVRVAAWPTSLPGDAREVGDCWKDLSVVAGIRRRGVDDERCSVPDNDEGVLRAQLPAVNRAWASGIATTECANRHAIDACQLGFKDAGPPEQREKKHMEVVPHAGFVPSSKTAVSGAARTAEFEWHVFPTAPSHQHVLQDFDHRAVRHSRPAAFRPHGLFRRQQSLQLRKERIRHPSTCHPGSLHGSRRP